MMKFKKFLAAVMTGAMMFGVVATAAPTVSVYATPATKIILEADDKTVGQGQFIWIHASTDGTGEDANPTITFSVPEIDGVEIDKASGRLSVSPDVPVDTKITVTAESTSPALTETIDIIVTKKQTASYEFGGEEELNAGAPYLSIQDCDGNYIYIAYYSDKEGKKLKSTYVYTSKEIDYGFSLAGFNLKKGASFRVYDELTDVNNVHLVVVESQSEKVKVKVKDFTKDALWDVLEIKVGNTTITESNYKDYADKLFIDGVPLAYKESTEWVHDLKIAARATGMTFYVKYLADKNSTASETKFKVSAAPKAPKVTIDYVKGNYTIAKNTYYTIANVDEDGIITIPDVALKKADDKLELSIEDVITRAPKVYVKIESDATFDENMIYYYEDNTYTEVADLDADTFRPSLYYTLDSSSSKRDKYVLATSFSSTGKYYTRTKTEYTKASSNDVTKDNFADQKNELHIEQVQTAAAIIAQSPAKNSKMESLMTVYKVGVSNLKNLDVSYSADHKTATYSMGTGSDKVTVATLTYSDTGVTVTAGSKDIAYWDTAATTPKWVTLKATKSTKKEIALTGEETLKFKLLGDKKTAEYGSVEVVTENVYLTKKPIEVIEKMENLTTDSSDFDSKATYYSDEKCETKATVSATEAGTYYLQAVYTLVPEDVESPVENTHYYTTTDKKVFTKAENLEAFVSGTDYYTRTVK